jgi:two-component system, NarL family, sensor histidine kinase UhpB
MNPAAAAVSAAPVAAPESRGQSLRLRLNLIVVAVVLVFLASLLWLRIEATRASVSEEIVASNRIATQLLERVSWIIASGGPPAMLSFLRELGRVRANDIMLVDDSGRTLYRSPPPTYKQGRSAPQWFSALVAPPLQRQVIVFGDARLTVEADPSRSILDGWDELQQLALIAGLELIVVNAIVFWAVGRTLRPFGMIIASLDRMQAGDYGVRLPRLAGREASLIGASVNRLGEAIEANLQQRIVAHETERRLAESREWAQRVEEHLESERREIAGELHDELGQSVTAIRALARSLDGRLPFDDTLGRDAVRLIESEAVHLYDAMHGMIPRLTPLDLGPLGLPDALHDLVLAMGRLHPGIQVTLQVRDMDAPVAAAPALAAYRVAQEGLTNAIRHSGGRCIVLQLSRTGSDHMTLTVDDDGCGLPSPEQRPARFGLTGLRQRVLALGGTFDCVRGPLHGTRLSAVLPLQAPSP